MKSTSGPHLQPSHSVLPLGAEPSLSCCYNEGSTGGFQNSEEALAFHSIIVGFLEEPTPKMHVSIFNLDLVKFSVHVGWACVFQFFSPVWCVDHGAQDWSL